MGQLKAIVLSTYSDKFGLYKTTQNACHAYYYCYGNQRVEQSRLLCNRFLLSFTPHGATFNDGNRPILQHMQRRARQPLPTSKGPVIVKILVSRHDLPENHEQAAQLAPTATCFCHLCLCRRSEIIKLNSEASNLIRRQRHPAATARQRAGALALTSKTDQKEHLRNFGLKSSVPIYETVGLAFNVHRQLPLDFSHSEPGLAARLIAALFDDILTPKALSILSATLRNNLISKGSYVAIPPFSTHATYTFAIRVHLVSMLPFLLISGVIAQAKTRPSHSFDYFKQKVGTAMKARWRKSSAGEASILLKLAGYILDFSHSLFVCFKPSYEENAYANLPAVLVKGRLALREVS